MESNAAVCFTFSDNSPRATWTPRRPSIGIDPHSVEPVAVLSAEEIDVFHRKFARFNPYTNKTRSLPAGDAMKLFRDDFPLLSEWEIQSLFQKCDLNCDGKLALREYVQTRAYHRLVVEAENELDIVRSFTILDTDNDGLLLAEEVLSLVQQSKQPGATILKQAILQAAEATRIASSDQSRRSKHIHSSPVAAATGMDGSRGEITLEHLTTTIRDINRAVEREIAAKTLRIFALHDKLDGLQAAVQEPALSASKRAGLLSKVQSTRIELEVVRAEVARCKRELFADAGQSGALGKICETLVASYDNEQHVYECLNSFIKYCGLEDPVIFRYNLEQSGREVHVLDFILMTPPAHVTKSRAYTEMLELSICHDDHDQLQQNELSTSRCPSTSRTQTTETGMRYRRLQMNATLRKQFVFYTMLGDVTNLESMTRSSFIKFVKDCKLNLLQVPNLTDPDISNIFSRANSILSESCHRLQQRLSSTPSRNTSMNFLSWLIGCDLIFQRAEMTGRQLDADELESKMKVHVIAKAHCIQSQNIAPDISQSHVLKLLRQHIWQLRQIFLHFTAQSLLEIDNCGALTMRQFLHFARAFKILRASDERDGEPYSPLTSAAIHPISLVELMREYYAAKLDVSFSNSRRRDQLDMNLREFLRCIQRVSLAMHARTQKKKPGSEFALGVLTTPFGAIKDDDERQAKRTDIPLYHRRGNLLGMAASPTKNCKMTSTSIISKLLVTSRAISANKKLSDITHEHQNSENTINALRSRSPTRIFYGDNGAASVIPCTPQSILESKGVTKSLRWSTRSKASDTIEPWTPPYRPISDLPTTRESALTPRSPRYHRPITCGGPPIVRVIRTPDSCGTST